LALIATHGTRSLPLLASWGSVQLARLKQQVRRFPSFIFEMVTSTRRRECQGCWWH
jgi:hypothetical protein